MNILVAILAVAVVAATGKYTYESLIYRLGEADDKKEESKCTR